MTDEKSDDGDKRPAPPYVSFKTLKTFVASVKEHGVPGRIDRTILPNFSGAVAGQLITALRFLHLINADGEPTQSLKTIVDAYDTADWKGELGGVLQKAYRPLFSLDLTTASPSQFNEQFAKSFSAEGDTMRKCVTFFLNAADEAGISISPYISKARKPRGTNGRKKTSKKSAISARGPGMREPPPPPPPPVEQSISEMLFELLDPLSMNDEEQQAVWTLMKYVKANDL